MNLKKANIKLFLTKRLAIFLAVCYLVIPSQNLLFKLMHEFSHGFDQKNSHAHSAYVHHTHDHQHAEDHKEVNSHHHDHKLLAIIKSFIPEKGDLEHYIYKESKLDTHLFNDITFLDITSYYDYEKTENLFFKKDLLPGFYQRIKPPPRLI